jgi:hypothetical protein
MMGNPVTCSNIASKAKRWVALATADPAERRAIEATFAVG